MPGAGSDLMALRYLHRPIEGLAPGLYKATFKFPDSAGSTKDPSLGPGTFPMQTAYDLYRTEVLCS